MSVMDALDGLGYALDTPRALAFGALGGAPGTRMSGRELLEKYGILGANKPGLDLGDVAGFGLELALDPMNLLMGAGIASKAAKASRIRAANKLSKSMRAAGAMPEEIVSKLHPSVLDSAGNPKRWYHGTDEAFDRFDMGRASPQGQVGAGVYFTDNPKIANSYTTKGGSYGRMTKNAVKPGREEELMRLREQHFGNDDYTPSLNSVVRDLERHPGQTVSAERAAFQDAAAPLMQQEFTARRPANVRMHYLGVENPLNLEDVANANPFINAHRMPDESLLDFARRKGFDAVQETGGGPPRHNVTVVGSPSQIYSPYIAPALKPVPQLKRRLAALLAYNAARGREED